MMDASPSDLSPSGVGSGHRGAEPDHQTPPWMNRALCREAPAGMFFPSDGVGVDRARKVCADCPVKAPCLEYALEFRIEHGVWGGCSERERRRILRRRRLTAAR